MAAFEHLRNFRDFEGYHKNDRTLLKGNVFARSENPAFLSEEEVSELKRRGLTCVVDLRRDHELAMRPDFLATAPGFTYHHIVMNDDPYTQFNEVVTIEDIAAAFFSKLTVSADRIAAIFKIFAQTDAGVLFHCESGKDRTGTISALLLLLNDATDADIVEDYWRSYDAMYFEGNESLLSDPTLVPKRETMEHFLALFREAYADCDAYFLKIGMTASDLERIRKKYAES